ncbi:unnamed protein product, partial [Rotaria sp. Silwood2]
AHQLSITNELFTENSSHDNETTALEIAAEQMCLNSQKTLEEQTIYALAIHYMKLIVYSKLPLDMSPSSNIQQSIYNHVTYTIPNDSDSLTSDFYYSINDSFKVKPFFKKISIHCGLSKVSVRSIAASVNVFNMKAVRRNYREIDEDEDEYEEEQEQEIENDNESDYEEETRNQRRSKRVRRLSPSSTNDKS